MTVPSTINYPTRVEFGEGEVAWVALPQPHAWLLAVCELDAAGLKLAAAALVEVGRHSREGRDEKTAKRRAAQRIRVAGIQARVSNEKARPKSLRMKTESTNRSATRSAGSEALMSLRCDPAGAARRDFQMFPQAGR